MAFEGTQPTQEPVNVRNALRLQPKDEAELQAVEQYLDHVFEYHSPSGDQVEAYAEIRQQAKGMARVIFLRCPPSADRTTALRRLRESVMVANASIATDGDA